jgi:hypothetical protein
LARNLCLAGGVFQNSYGNASQRNFAHPEAITRGDTAALAASLQLGVGLEHGCAGRNEEQTLMGLGDNRDTDGRMVVPIL